MPAHAVCCGPGMQTSPPCDSGELSNPFTQLGRGEAAAVKELALSRHTVAGGERGLLWGLCLPQACSSSPN